MTKNSANAQMVTKLMFRLLPVQILLAAVAYVPAGIALGWTYEKSNTIWAPILLHMTINAISFGVMHFLEV